MATKTPLDLDEALDDLVTSASSSKPKFYHYNLPIRTASMASPKKSVIFADEAGQNLVDEKVIHDGDLRFSKAQTTRSDKPLSSQILESKREREDEDEEEEDEDLWRQKRGRGMAPSPEPAAPTVTTSNLGSEPNACDNDNYNRSEAPLFTIPTPDSSSWTTDVLTHTPAIAPTSAPVDAQIDLPDYEDSSGDESRPMPSLAAFYAAHCPPSQEIEMESIEEPYFPETEVVLSIEHNMSNCEYEEQYEPPHLVFEPVSVCVEMENSEDTSEDEVPFPIAYPEQTPFEAELAVFLKEPLDPIIIENIHPSSLATSTHLKRCALSIEELLANGALLYESIGEDYWAAVYRTKLEEFVLARTDGAFEASQAFIEMKYALGQEEMARQEEMTRLMQYEEEMKQKKQQQQQRRQRIAERLKEVKGLREAKAEREQKKKRHSERRRQEKRKSRHAMRSQGSHRNGAVRPSEGPKSEFNIRGTASRRERY